MLAYHLGVLLPLARRASAARGLDKGYAFGGDFYPVWLASREWIRSDRDPYSAEMTRGIQIALFGRPLDPRVSTDYEDLRMFAHPAFTVLLFWPFSEFPFPISRIVIVCLSAGLTLASAIIWARALNWWSQWEYRVAIALLTISSYPALEGLYSGQLGLLVAFFLGASVIALKRGRYLLAGTMLTLTTIKPQVTALAIVYLLLWALHDWTKKKRFVVGFFSMVTLFVGASLAALPHWIQGWVRTILTYRHYARPPLVTEVLTSPFGPRIAGPATLVLTASAIIIAVVLAWRNRSAALDSLAFWLTLSLLLAITTIIILPGQAVYDHLILIPAILLLVRHWGRFRDSGRIPRILLSMGAMVLFWPWIAAFGLIVARPWIQPATFDSTVVLSLPIRTAASLPLVVLALLGWLQRISSVKPQGVA